MNFWIFSIWNLLGFKFYFLSFMFSIYNINTSKFDVYEANKKNGFQRINFSSLNQLKFINGHIKKYITAEL